MNKVKLRVIATGRVVEFDKDHAERILKHENSGWEIVIDDKHTKEDKKQKE